MERKSTFWVPSPDDGETVNWLRCRLADEWYSTDGDRAIVPVTKLARNGEQNPEKRTGLLVQFGGADLILDLVSLDAEQGDEFVVINPTDGRPYIDESHEAVTD